LKILDWEHQGRTKIKEKAMQKVNINTQKPPSKVTFAPWQDVEDSQPSPVDIPRTGLWRFCRD
jgi:hypothetical protein